MQQIGYSLVDADGVEIQYWGNSMNDCPKLPEVIHLPNGDHVYSPRFGQMQDWRFVPRMGQYGTAPPSYDGTQVIASIPVSEADIVRERQRRFNQGFDYNFQDERGTHRIGTTPEDMVGWDEVTKLAQAAINMAQPDTPISITTNTATVVVTAFEWQKILVAAGQARQPIWAASFKMLKQQPIPSDFQSDAAWA